jgi:hypothetical protein
LLFADAYDARWRASTARGDLHHLRAFGWSNAYTAPAGGTVDILFVAGASRGFWLLFELVLWVGAVAGWFVLRRRDAKVVAV